MSAQHTPGPWGYEIDRELNCTVAVPNSIYNIATVYTTDGSHDQQEANARLIAAAPELLEAARLAVIDLMATNGPTSGAATNIERLSDAIAKAEGRS